MPRKSKTRNEAALLSQGITEAIPNEKLIAKINEGLDATVVKTATSEGNISDEKVYVDYRTRLQYIREGVKLSKRFIPSPPQLTGAIFNGPVQIIVKHIGKATPTTRIYPEPDRIPAETE